MLIAEQRAHHHMQTILKYRKPTLIVLFVRHLHFFLPIFRL